MSETNNITKSNSKYSIHSKYFKYFKHFKYFKYFSHFFIKSFTLIELLVVMVISSIVIGTGITIYLNITHMYGKSVKEMEKINNLVFIETLLYHDFECSSRITRQGNGILLEFSGKKIINYEFDNDYIVRATAGVSDTFFCAAHEPEIFTLENSRYVNELRFTLHIDNHQPPMHFFKEYAADVLLNSVSP